MDALFNWQLVIRTQSLALTEDGWAFGWGFLRNSKGLIGLTVNGKQDLPIFLLPNMLVKKVASGADHISLHALEGAVYTVGISEQGQLGRVAKYAAHQGGQQGLKILLTPDRIPGLSKSKILGSSPKTRSWGNFPPFLLASPPRCFLLLALGNMHCI